MLVLHGSWLPGRGNRDARFAIWGEAKESGRKRRHPPRRAVSSGDRIARHPFAATGLELEDVLAGTGRKSGCDLAMERIIVRLPSSDAAPLPSPDLADTDDLSDEMNRSLGTWRVEAQLYCPAQMPCVLVALDGGSLPPHVVVGDDLRYWTVAARLALELLHRQRFVPTLRREGDDFVARWHPLFESPIDLLDVAHDGESDQQRLDILTRAMPPAGRALSWQVDEPESQPGDLLLDFLGHAVDAGARAATPFGQLPTASQRNLGELWLGALQEEPAIRDGFLLDSTYGDFYGQYRAWAGAEARGQETFRICFRLTPPPSEAEAIALGPSPKAWTLEYLLQAIDDPSLLVPAAEVWRRSQSSARFLNRRFDNPQERLLAGLGRAARLFPPIEHGLRAPRPEVCALSLTEAHDFVREKALLLRSDGFGILVPSLQAKMGVRVKLKGSTKSQAHSVLGWERIVAYDWEVMLGDEPLSRAEFEALAALKQPLVQVRGQWVELKPEQVDQALALFGGRAGEGEMALSEAVRLAVAPDGDRGLPVVEVVAEGWIDELLHRLGQGERREELTEPEGFVGQLRPYQRVGLSWLASLRRYGLGACLADDMGLGKTIQIIALMLHERRQGDRMAPLLLVCPTSVVGNWRHELERFAPTLRVLVHHGAARKKEEFPETAGEHDVVLTTYALLHRDEEELAAVEWDAVILDEAQNIKNPSTKAARQARRLRAGWRAALTGTPVENHLSDLWSVFQFLNPGYLGSGEEFKRRFADPIERLHQARSSALLKKLITPFVLRRLKSDPTIIADLPEKNEMKVFCNLTKEQATLYAAVVQDSIRQIEEAEGIKRRGVVLATMAKLKQVCDHPALFLKDGSPLGARSGKLTRLGEMLEEVLAVDERALVFTQYAEMGKLLKACLSERFDREVLFLHGGTPAPERDRMITRFQAEGKGPHLFVLSLKAGGTGLNLTGASHVFHFDRWWNPAVENQATDRAFRIGQRRNVQVHKFICAATFEEAIDGLIERKQELAETVVGAGEAWITELSTAELRELFALRGGAVAED